MVRFTMIRVKAGGRLRQLAAWAVMEGRDL